MKKVAHLFFISLVFSGCALNSSTLPKNDPNYIDYYQSVRDKIKNQAYGIYGFYTPEGLEGEVTLQFAVLRDGKVDEVVIESADSDTLKNITLLAFDKVKRFPKFPAALWGDYEKLQFKLNLIYKDDNKPLTLEDIPSNGIGISLKEVNNDIRFIYGLDNIEGVMIVNVVAGSPAQTQGLRPGDIILSINGEKANNTRSAVNAILHSKNDIIMITNRGKFVIER